MEKSGQEIGREAGMELSSSPPACLFLKGSPLPVPTTHFLGSICLQAVSPLSKHRPLRGGLQRAACELPPPSPPCGLSTPGGPSSGSCGTME